MAIRRSNGKHLELMARGRKEASEEWMVALSLQKLQNSEVASGRNAARD